MGSALNKVTKWVTHGLVKDVTGMEAAQEASLGAARTAAEAQTQALNYLREREALPQEYREAALRQLGGLYGLGEGDQAAAIESLKQTPLYGAILGGREAGEEAIMRQAAATGGLRSGNVQQNLYDYNVNLENQALLQSMQGLTGMAQLPSMAPQIAQGIAGIGQTQAQGIQAAGQAEQATTGMILSGLGQAAGAYFSDERLKENIKEIGEKKGHKIFSWDWNKKAKRLFGLEGSDTGVIAQMVEKYMPEAIKEYQGYKTVDKEMLGI